jgi:MFS family permease
LRAGDLALARSTLAVPHGALVLLGLLAMLSLMIEGAVADWSGTLLAQGGADARSMTFGYGAFSCAMAGGRMAGDWLISRLGPATIVRWGGVLTGLGLALVALMPTPFTGAVGFGMVGLGLSNVVPTVFSATGRLGASAAAAVVTTGFAGMLLGPVAIGGIATAVNLRWGIAVLGAGAATISILARAVTSAPDIHNHRNLGQ